MWAKRRRLLAAEDSLNRAALAAGVVKDVMEGHHDRALQHVQEQKEAEMPPTPSWSPEAAAPFWRAPEEELPFVVALWKRDLFLQHDKATSARDKRPGSHQQHVRSSSSDSCYGSTRYLYEVTWQCSFLFKGWIAFIMGTSRNRMS